MRFKEGDKVRIVSSTNGSVNKADDVGTIVDHHPDPQDGLDYRVLVNGRLKIANWHTEAELELIQD